MLVFVFVVRLLFIFWQIWTRREDFVGSGDDASIMERKLSETCFSAQLGMTDGGNFLFLCSFFWFTQTFNKDCSFPKNSKYQRCRYYKSGLCRPATKDISVEILRASIKQIATLCYHQYKLNGANLKDGAMNIIPLNIRKPN